jgi:hypothetical protein
VVTFSLTHKRNSSTVLPIKSKVLSHNTTEQIKYEKRLIDEKKLFETETKILREKLKIKQVSELNTLQRDIMNILDVPLYYYDYQYLYDSS